MSILGIVTNSYKFSDFWLFYVDEESIRGELLRTSAIQVCCDQWPPSKFESLLKNGWPIRKKFSVFSSIATVMNRMLDTYFSHLEGNDHIYVKTPYDAKEQVKNRQLWLLRHTIRKVKFLSENSILTKPQHFHEFFTPNFFWQFFSWNQSCQQLKSPKPQHFHEFFTPKKLTIFSKKPKLNFWIKNEDFEQLQNTKKNRESLFTLFWRFFLQNYNFPKIY